MYTQYLFSFVICYMLREKAISISWLRTRVLLIVVMMFVKPAESSRRMKILIVSLILLVSADCSGKILFKQANAP